MICGSENNPEKRWPIAHWRKLIAALPKEKFQLLGTSNDCATTTEIVRSFENRTNNLTGRTDLSQFFDALCQSKLLVINGTGGMHLANAFGVPLIALFGPTNPICTGPVFSGPAVVLQPPGCAPTGGGDLAMISPQTTVAAVRDMLTASASTPSPVPSSLFDVTDLHTSSYTHNGVFRAVDGVSFSLACEEVLDIASEPGSGKSVTCYSLMGLITQPLGHIESGFALFQDTDLLKA